MASIYSDDDLKNHATKESLWLAIGGRVYDCTKFLQEHPGGEEILLESAGGDATEAFEDIGHSEDAREMLKEYDIGEYKAPEGGSAKKEEKKTEEGGAQGGGCSLM